MILTHSILTDAVICSSLGRTIRNDTSDFTFFRSYARFLTTCSPSFDFDCTLVIVARADTKRLYDRAVAPSGLARYRYIDLVSTIVSIILIA